MVEKVTKNKKEKKIKLNNIEAVTGSSKMQLSTYNEVIRGTKQLNYGGLDLYYVEDSEVKMGDKTSGLLADKKMTIYECRPKESKTHNPNYQGLVIPYWYYTKKETFELMDPSTIFI